MTARIWPWIACAALGACSSAPPAPDWQLQAHDSHQRATAAYLAGQPSKAPVQVHDAEWQRARFALTSTARPDLLARLELAACATQLAALDAVALQGCARYQRWDTAATPAELAYAAYLGGKPTVDSLALLPPGHQAVARAMLAPTDAMPALHALADPLARLVACAALLQIGQLPPQGLDLAVDTASAQGWRRPLAAWLAVQERQAVGAGDTARAARARQRLSMLLAE